MMSETEQLAYAAGLIDGEGCITIKKQRSSHGGKYLGRNYTPAYRPTLTVEMCDRGGLDALLAWFGGSIIIHKARLSRHRVRYAWYLSCDRAVDLLRRVSPFLLVKRRQAEVAIELQASHRQWETQKRNRLIGHRVPLDEVSRREALKQKINVLNAKGNP